MTLDKPIELCFICDDAYLQHMTAAAASAADHTGRRLNLWLIHPGLSAASFEKLAQFEKMFSNLTIHLVEGSLKPFEGMPPPEKWPELIYLKLQLPELLPVDRVLMLDCDIIVLDDLAKIFDLPFPEGIHIAACNDLASQRKLDDRRLKTGDYFNAGVMMFDLEALRKEHFFPRVLEVPPEVLRKIKCPEQDLLNWYFGGKWLRLSSRWNLFSGLSRHRIRKKFRPVKDDLFDVLKSPGIVHYTADKPWKYALSRTPYDKYYRCYLKKTPFADYHYPPFRWRDVLLLILPWRLRKKLGRKFDAARSRKNH